jgi:tetratricopeptide (TPR) repeat protein
LAVLSRRDQADAEYQSALELSPHSRELLVEMYRNRAHRCVDKGEFGKASDEFSRAREATPHDADLWNYEAECRLAAGDLPGYRRLCAEMLSRFRDTKDPRTAHQVIFSCVLIPDSVADMRDLIPLAEVAAPMHHGNVRVLGAAFFRAGRYAEAVARLEESARMYQPRPWELCFSAMAYHYLGQKKHAADCLARARKWIADAGGTHDDLSWIPNYYYDWEERIEFPLLMHEAESIIDGKSN